jgi:hypothetical protein
MSKSAPQKLGISDDPHGPRVTLRQCLDAALHQSEGLMDKVLNALAGKADKSFGAYQHKPNFPPEMQAVAEQLLRQREVIKTSFRGHLIECVFGGVGVDAQAPQMMRFEDLKLFEEEDLDESIEIARAMQEMSLMVADELVVRLDHSAVTKSTRCVLRCTHVPCAPALPSRSVTQTCAARCCRLWHHVWV